MNPRLIFHYLILLHQCHNFCCSSDISLSDKHWCNFSCCGLILSLCCSLKLWISGILPGYWCLGVILSYFLPGLAFCLCCALTFLTITHLSRQCHITARKSLILCTHSTKGALRASLVWAIPVPGVRNLWGILIPTLHSHLGNGNTAGRAERFSLKSKAWKDLCHALGLHLSKNRNRVT